MRLFLLYSIFLLKPLLINCCTTPATIDLTTNQVVTLCTWTRGKVVGFVCLSFVFCCLWPQKLPDLKIWASVWFVSCLLGCWKTAKKTALSLSLNEQCKYLFYLPHLLTTPTNVSQIGMQWDAVHGVCALQSSLSFTDLSLLQCFQKVNCCMSKLVIWPQQYYVYRL